MAPLWLDDLIKGQWTIFSQAQCVFFLPLVIFVRFWRQISIVKAYFFILATDFFAIFPFLSLLNVAVTFNNKSGDLDVYLSLERRKQNNIKNIQRSGVMQKNLFRFSNKVTENFTLLLIHLLSKVMKLFVIILFYWQP